jgi:hypothetical protein
VIGVSRTAKLARTRINDADKNDIVLAFFIGGAPPVLVEVHRSERSGGDGGWEVCARRVDNTPTQDFCQYGEFPHKSSSKRAEGVLVNYRS